MNGPATETGYALYLVVFGVTVRLKQSAKPLEKPSGVFAAPVRLVLKAAYRHLLYRVVGSLFCGYGQKSGE